MSPFVEFDNKHVASLENEPWQVREGSDSRMWLFKFHASEELGCCFLITDTIHVWGEALEMRHLLRRHAKRQGAGNEGDFQDHDDPEWRYARVRDLVRLHAQSAAAGDPVEFSTESGTLNADLEITIASPSYSWKWETISLGAKLGPQILSRQLLLPLVTFSEFALKASQPLSQMDEASWTKQLDVTAKTGRVVNLTQTLFRKPRVSSSFARISQTMNRVTTPTPVVSIFAEPQALNADWPFKERHDPFVAPFPYGTETLPNPQKTVVSLPASTDTKKGVFKEPASAPMVVDDENSPIRNVQEEMPNNNLSSIIRTRQSLTPPPSTEVGSSRQSPSKQDAKAPPALETLSDGEGTETDNDENEGPRPSPANTRRNQPSAMAKPSRGGSDGSGSGTDSGSSPQKPKSKPGPKRKVSSDEDDSDSDRATKPKTARTGGAGWQGPRKAMARKKRF